MERRSPAVYVLAASLAVLVVGLVLTLLPGPGLLVAVAGALGMFLGLALLMAEHRSDDESATTPDPPTLDGRYATAEPSASDPSARRTAGPRQPIGSSRCAW